MRICDSCGATQRARYLTESLKVILRSEPQAVNHTTTLQVRSIGDLCGDCLENVKARIEEIVSRPPTGPTT